MRVAIFTETFHQINGVAMVYNRFARWCERNNYQVEIFTPGKKDHTEDRGCVKIHTVKMLLPFPYYHGLYFDLLARKAVLRKYFSKNKFDLIHIATQGHAGLQGLHIAQKFNLPQISCYHTAIPEYARDRFIKVLGDNPFGRLLAKGAFNLCWWFQRKLFKSSHIILVPTQSIKDMVERELCIPGAFFTRGVDSEAFSPEKRSRDDNEVITLYAGRISIEKNLQLMEKLDLAGGSGIRFVGDGPYKAHLEKVLPEAEFTGFLQGEELQQAYSDSDIFLFPSKTDTFGNAVLEAMSAGLPVVVTNVLGPKDFVIHGETGFIAKDDEEFVKYHRMLVDDTEMRKEMGKKARAYALKQSWDHIFETQLIDNYRKVLRESQQGAN